MTSPIATMMPEDHQQRVRQIYAAALQRDPEERPGFLDVQCAGNVALRADVAELLARHSDGSRKSSVFETGARPQDSEQSQTAEGKIIGQYVVRRELGRGGMGVVYLADDTRLARRVALKSLTPGLDQALGGRERLRLEARAAAALSHPGIATVYALEEIDNQLYLACEYVPGEPLRTLLDLGPLPFSQVVAIGAQLARALAAAHAMGVVHRDIKPENVVKTPSGVVKVLDFGLARFDDDAHPKLTQTGVILGTPAYLAPEQVMGKRADFRTDLFALGLLLYELASGINPFAAPSVTATIARIVETEPPPLSSLQPGILPELNQIVDRCLRKDPLDRYSSTQEVVSEFERLEAAIASLRQKQSDRIDGARQPAHNVATPHSGARWWWEVHQVIVSLVYAAMIFPTWYMRHSLSSPWDTTFLFTVLASGACATSLRLHLYFLARHVDSELVAQRARTLPWLRLAEGGFAASQFIGAAAMVKGHTEFAMLFITVATVTLVGALVIEPAMARATFGDQITRQSARAQ